MWSPRFVFIHVPRTGGTILTEAFGARPDISKDVHHNKHAPASRARELLPEIWPTARVFCVVRPDLEIAESWFRHCVASVPLLEANAAHQAGDEWVEYCRDLAAMGLDRFLKSGLAPRVDHYADLPEVERLTWSEAYRVLCDLVGRVP